MRIQYSYIQEEPESQLTTQKTDESEKKGRSNNKRFPSGAFEATATKADPDTKTSHSIHSQFTSIFSNMKHSQNWQLHSNKVSQFTSQQPHVQSQDARFFLNADENQHVTFEAYNCEQSTARKNISNQLTSDHVIYEEDGPDIQLRQPTSYKKTNHQIQARPELHKNAYALSPSESKSISSTISGSKPRNELTINSYATSKQGTSNRTTQSN